MKTKKQPKPQHPYASGMIIPIGDNERGEAFQNSAADARTFGPEVEFTYHTHDRLGTIVYADLI